MYIKVHRHSLKKVYLNQHAQHVHYMRTLVGYSPFTQALVPGPIRGQHGSTHPDMPCECEPSRTRMANLKQPCQHGLACIHCLNSNQAKLYSRVLRLLLINLKDSYFSNTTKLYSPRISALVSTQSFSSLAPSVLACAFCSSCQENW